MKKIYRYDPESHEFTIANDAKLDTVTSRIKKKNVYRLPANATYIKPSKTKKNETAIFQDGKWVKVLDYRGELYHTEDDTTTRRIESIGELPEDFILGEYVKTKKELLEDSKLEKMIEIKHVFLNKVGQGVKIKAGKKTYHMDCTSDAVVILKYGIEFAESTGETSITITDYKNVDHEGVSIADARTINNKQFEHFMSLRLRKNILRKKINEGDLTVSWNDK